MSLNHRALFRYFLTRPDWTVFASCIECRVSLRIVRGTDNRLLACWVCGLQIPRKIHRTKSGYILPYNVRAGAHDSSEKRRESIYSHRRGASKASGVIPYFGADQARLPKEG